MAEEAAGGQRIDKWLWFARVAKSRTLAAALVTAGKVRLNRVKVHKPGLSVRPGDVLTVALRERVRVMKVLRAGSRREGPQEARLLYEEVSSGGGVAGRDPGGD